MNFYIKSLLVALLVALPFFSALAEDDSCELKQNSQNNTQADSVNEFTIDKTWRFKAEERLESVTTDKNQPGKTISPSSSKS